MDSRALDAESTGSVTFTQVPVDSDGVIRMPVVEYNCSETTGDDRLPVVHGAATSVHGRYGGKACTKTDTGNETVLTAEGERAFTALAVAAPKLGGSDTEMTSPAAMRAFADSSDGALMGDTRKADKCAVD
jgi:hypothetical protein